MPVQIELMRPEELDAARDRFPVAYLPIGSLEFHGYHLPVGLDTIKCHRMLCRVAEATGGLVTPPLFYGHGGGHAEFPWTWMLDRETVFKIVLGTLFGLERNGFKVIVLMSGHYPNEDMFPALVQEHAKQGGKAKILPLMEYHAFPKDGEFHGDHAAKWETAYMLALADELVDMQRAKQNPDGRDIAQFANPQPGTPGGWWFEHNPEHPWYGIATVAGASPLDATKEIGEAAVQHIVDWVRGKVSAALAESV